MVEEVADQEALLALGRIDRRFTKPQPKLLGRSPRPANLQRRQRQPAAGGAEHHPR